MLKKILADELGATAAEYGLFIALISLAIIASVILLGKELEMLFNTLANMFSRT